MQEWNKVFFVSSNKHKYLEAKQILKKFGIDLAFFQANLMEIQSDSLSEIAKQKSLSAFSKCKKPLIIEDDALVISSIGGFPGPYSSYVFGTIGNKGVLSLVKGKRIAKFHANVTYCDKKRKPVIFEGVIHGKIANNVSGKGWGYDPIFIPKGKTKTFAQISDKNTISHRYLALAKFAKWFTHMQK